MTLTFWDGRDMGSLLGELLVARQNRLFAIRLTFVLRSQSVKHKSDLVLNFIRALPSRVGTASAIRPGNRFHAGIARSICQQCVGSQAEKNAFSLFCGLRPPVDPAVINQHSLTINSGKVRNVLKAD